jgi:hypothetical protein
MTEVWNADELMGLKGAPESPSSHPQQQQQQRRLSSFRHKKQVEPADWGRPGHLTQDEVDVYMKFKEQVESRGGEFRNTVYCFGEEEGEAFALTRWLRARKFVYDDTMIMVEEATECRAAARAVDFYPEPVDALGCSAALFYALYPQVYTGHAKCGAPLFISKPGILNVDGMECITTLDGIVKFHWHVMIHDFAARLRARKVEDPSFKRFECFCVLDLAHLSTSQLNSRAMSIIKEQSFIDSLCFPETMAKMVIVNAPRFFSLSWSVIKGWLDQRTANKVEVISSKKASEKRLLELVDAQYLPCDYGGKGPDTNDLIDSTCTGGMKRLFHEVLYLRGHGSIIVDVAEGEEMEVAVWTRSTSGAAFSVTHAEQKHGSPYVENVEVKHHGTEDVTEPPTSATLTKERIVGPAKIKVKADSHAGRFSTHNYMVVFEIY